MSADNWRECPCCARQAEERHKERQKTAEEAYGKVGRAEFERRQAEVGTVESVGETLREDYEFWIDDVGGLFHARYKAGCATCGFSHEFTHEAPTSETALDPSPMTGKATG